MVACIFDNVHLFYEGLAKVELNRKCGFIDIKGNFIIPCIYDAINWHNEYFNEGLASVVSK
jgi:hypothetical protein